MSIRLLAIGDPHFREGTVSEMDFFVSFTLQWIDDNLDKIDYIVVLGDVMDRHGVLHQTPFHQACKFLFELGSRRDTYVLIGNHDFDNPSKFLPENHPFVMWSISHCPGVHIIDKPKKFSINGVNTLFVPYVPPGKFYDAVEMIPGNPLAECPMGFTHQEFKGCRMGPVISDTGDVYPRNQNDRTYLICGHIHERQEIGNQILYVGTPIQNGFGDSYSNKGLCYAHIELDHETKTTIMEKKFTYIHVPVPRRRTERIKDSKLEEWVIREYNNTYGIIKTNKSIDSVSSLTRYHKKNSNKQIRTPLDKIRLIILRTTNNEVSRTTLKHIQELLPNIIKIVVEPNRDMFHPELERESNIEERKAVSLSDIIYTTYNPHGDKGRERIFRMIIRSDNHTEKME